MRGCSSSERGGGQRGVESHLQHSAALRCFQPEGRDSVPTVYTRRRMSHGARALHTSPGGIRVASPRHAAVCCPSLLAAPAAGTRLAWRWPGPHTVAGPAASGAASTNERACTQVEGHVHTAGRPCHRAVGGHRRGRAGGWFWRRGRGGRRWWWRRAASSCTATDGRRRGAGRWCRPGRERRPGRTALATRWQRRAGGRCVGDTRV